MNKTNTSIYVILLEENKYFVYSTDTAEYFDNNVLGNGQPLDEVIKYEIENLFEYPRIYKPVQIVETTWISDALDIDKTVKKYMMNYGIDSVRGGSYSLPTLCEFQYKALQMELAYLSSPYGNLSRLCSGKSHQQEKTLYNEEKMRHFLYNSMLSQELKYVSSQLIDKDIDRNDLLKKYATLCDKKENIKTKLHDFMYFMKDTKKYTMDKSILDNFTNIKQYLYGMNSQTFTHDEIKKSYNTTMIYLQHVISLIKKYKPDFITNEVFFSSANSENESTIHPVYFIFPHFLLDKVFLHKMYEEVDQAYHLWLGLEGMYYWALNIIDELTFDLEQLPDNIEWKSDVVNYYVTMLENSTKMADNSKIRKGFVV